MAGRILVVDDAVEVVDFFRSLLGQFGHEVIAAHDGESGLRKFHDELPDLVFLDLLLPRRDGSDVCAEIKRSEHGLITPVAIITGVYKNQSKVEAMRQHGVVDYLIKPVPVAKITALVDWALGDKPEEETTPDEDFELLRLQPPTGDETAAPLASGILPGMLARAEQERLTGVLFATRGKTRKALLLEDGRIVGARSNAPVDRIDCVLLAMRKVTPLQMSALRTAAQVKGDALAAAVLLNFIDQTEAHDARRFQAITTGLSMFRWNDGSVRFVPGETLDCPRLDRPIDPARLTLIGLRKNPALRQAVNRLQLRDDLTILRPDERALSLRDTDLARREREVFDLVDGRRSVFRLRQVSVLAQLPVDEVLSVLVGAGVLKVSQDAPTDSAGNALATASGTHRTGSLENVTFAELLGSLARDRANGSLVIEGRFRRRFVLQAGDVVHGRSSNPADMLGEILMQQGMVSKAILDEALQAQRDHRPDRRIGSLLFEMGALSLTTLEAGTRAQLLRVVESTFAWTEGIYCFEPAPSASEPSVSLGMGLLVLLRRGIATMSLDWLERRWCHGTEETFLVAVASSIARDDLAAEEREIIVLTVEGASIERIVADRGRDALFAVELLVAAGLAVTELRPRLAEATVTAAATTGAAAATTGETDAVAATATLDVGAITAPFAISIADEDELSIVTLEADEPAAVVQPAVDAAAVGSLLTFLRDEVLGERREAEREIRRLSEEMGRLGERVRGLEADKGALEAKNQQLDADHRARVESDRALRSGEGALEQTRHKLDADHRALAASNGKLEAEKSALEKAHHKLEADHRALAESSRKLEAEKSAIEKTRHKLEADHRALAESNRKLDAEKSAIEKTHHKLEAEHRALAENSRKLEAEHRALEEKARKLTADHRVLAESNHKLEADHRALVESSRKLEAEKDALEEKSHKLAADHRVLAESNRGLAADKGAVESRSHKLEADRRALETKIQALEAEIRALRAENRTLSSRQPIPPPPPQAVPVAPVAAVRPDAEAKVEAVAASPVAASPVAAIGPVVDARAGMLEPEPVKPPVPAVEVVRPEPVTAMRGAADPPPARGPAAAAGAKPRAARAGGTSEVSNASKAKKAKPAAASAAQKPKTKGSKAAKPDRELVPV